MPLVPAGRQLANGLPREPQEHRGCWTGRRGAEPSAGQEDVTRAQGRAGRDRPRLAVPGDTVAGRARAVDTGELGGGGATLVRLASHAPHAPKVMMARFVAAVPSGQRCRRFEFDSITLLIDAIDPRLASATLREACFHFPNSLVTSSDLYSTARRAPRTLPGRVPAPPPRARRMWMPR